MNWNLYAFLIRQFGLAGTSAESFIFLGAVVLCIVVPYLIGSINPAIIFSNALYHEDIRSYGSGNAGTTNTLRTYGKKMAVLIFILDLLKAALAIVFAAFIHSLQFGGAIAALFVVLGHMFPIYYKFKGGKGVACAAMCILMLSPASFAILLPLFILIVACFRYISLGSIMCAMLFPLLNYVFYRNHPWITLSAFCIGALIVFMHRENLKRLMEGKESKLSFKKTDKHAAASHNGNAANAKAAEDFKVEEPEREYSDDDFVKCSCGRLIPKAREKCAYCGAVNTKFVPSGEPEKGKKKKK